MYRLVISGEQLIIGKLLSGFDHRRRSPGTVVISCLGPSFYRSFLCRIVSFALEHGSQTHRSVIVIFPGLVIRDDRIAAAICIIHNQHSHQRRLVTVIVVVGALKCGHAGPPAFAENSTHRVFAFGKEIGHVIDIVSEDLIVLRRARVEPLFRSNLVPVDVIVIDALCSKIQPCGRNFPCRLKRSPQHRCGAICRICIADHSAFTAVYRDRVAFHSKSFKSLKDRKTGTGFLCKEGTSCKFSAVLDLVIGEHSTLTCIRCKTDAVQVREGVAASGLVHEYGIFDFRVIDRQRQCACRAENIDMMNVILIRRIQHAVQFLVLFHCKERY